MKTMLDEMLMEEYNRSLRAQKAKRAALINLPKGNLREKKIGNNIYYYLQWREGGHVRNKYVRKENIKNVKEQISYRDDILLAIKNIDSDIKKLRKVLKINDMNNEKINQKKPAFHWIRNDIILTAPMDSVMINTIEEAEELDLAGNYEYFCVADALDVLGKQMVACGKWSHKDWDLLCEKYPQE